MLNRPLGTGEGASQWHFNQSSLPRKCTSHLGFSLSQRIRCILEFKPKQDYGTIESYSPFETFRVIWDGRRYHTAQRLLYHTSVYVS